LCTIIDLRADPTLLDEQTGMSLEKPIAIVVTIEAEWFDAKTKLKIDDRFLEK
jgi:hypothetical protein